MAELADNKPGGGVGGKPEEAASAKKPRFGKPTPQRKKPVFGKAKSKPETVPEKPAQEKEAEPAKPEAEAAKPEAEAAKPEAKPDEPAQKKPVFGKAQKTAEPEAEAVKPEAKEEANEADDIDNLFADEDDEDDKPKRLRRKRKISEEEDEAPKKKARKNAPQEAEEAPRQVKNIEREAEIEEITEQPPEDEDEDMAEPEIPVQTPAVYDQGAITGQGGYIAPIDGQYVVAWNAHGRLLKKSKRPASNQIPYEVDTDDKSRRFMHEMDFSQADIGARGDVIMANGKRLKYLSVNGSSDWETELSAESVCVAICGEYLAIATDDSCLRIIQKASSNDTAFYFDIMKLPGVPIALVGAAPHLAVFYSKAGQVHVRMLDIKARTKLCELPVDISTDSELKWAHFSNTLYIMDSRNEVLMLRRNYGWCWTPVSGDFGDESLVHPVHIGENLSKEMVLYAATLNADGLPNPGGQLRELKLRVPIIDDAKPTATFGSINENLFRKRIMLEASLGPAKKKMKKRKGLDKSRIQLFGYALNSGYPEETCLAIAKQMEFKVTEEAALQLAMNGGSASLAGKMGRLVKAKAEARSAEAAPFQAAPSFLSKVGSTPVTKKRKPTPPVSSRKMANDTPKRSGIKSAHPVRKMAARKLQNPFAAKS